MQRRRYLRKTSLEEAQKIFLEHPGLGHFNKIEELPPRDSLGRITAEPTFRYTPFSNEDTIAAKSRKSLWEAAPAFSGSKPGCIWIISVPMATCTVTGIPRRAPAARMLLSASGSC